MTRFTDTTDAAYVKRERLFVAAFIVSVVLTEARILHDRWRMVMEEYLHPSASTKIYYLFYPGPHPLHAPEAYRVAVPALGNLLMKLLHLTDPTIMAVLIDILFGCAALYLFYRLAVDRIPVHTRKSERMLTVALFLSFAYFPVTWVVPWQRPETLPTALYVGVVMLCLMRARSSGLWTMLLLAATVWQGFVRADVALVMGVALMLASFFGSSLEEFGPRSSNFLKGAAMALLAGGVQAYMQFIRLPHLSYYPGTEVFMAIANLQLHPLVSSFLALLPFLLAGTFMAVKRIRLDAFGSLVVVSSVLYLGLWYAVGLLTEVRIYVPFMMALSVVAAKGMATFLSGEPRSSTARVS